MTDMTHKCYVVKDENEVYELNFYFLISHYFQIKNNYETQE